MHPNSIHGLEDFEDYPDISPFGPSKTLIVADNGALPTDWILSADTTPGSGSPLQRLFESFANERSAMTPAFHSVKAALISGIDTTEPDYAWYFELDDTVTTLEVAMIDETWITIQAARDDLELFYSAGWRFRQVGSTVLIFGFGLQEQTAQLRGGGTWQFIRHSKLWSPARPVFVRHPETFNWITLHPSMIRDDGFIGLSASGQVTLRTHCDEAVKSLPYVRVRVNGIERQAPRVNLWTSSDERGLEEGITRRDDELSTEHAPRIFAANWFGRDQTKEGLRNRLAAALAGFTVTSISASASGFDVPLDATGFSVRNVRREIYVTEDNAPYDADTSGYRSAIASPSLGMGFLDGSASQLTKIKDGVYSLDTAWGQGDTLSLPSFRWCVPLWDVTGASVVFTENMSPKGPDLVVLFSKALDVTDADVTTRRKSFDRTWPTLRWRGKVGNDQGEATISGLATFE